MAEEALFSSVILCTHFLTSVAEQVAEIPRRAFEFPFLCFFNGIIDLC